MGSRVSAKASIIINDGMNNLVKKKPEVIF